MGTPPPPSTTTDDMPIPPSSPRSQTQTNQSPPTAVPTLPTEPQQQTTHPPKPGPKKPKPAPNSGRMPGKSLLPTARVQRILKADKELPSCNKEAVFLISVAAEEFIKRLGQAGQQQAIREKRMTVQRKDITTAVRRGEEFVFLEELLSVPAPAPPPAKPRKPKPTATATGITTNPANNDNLSIKEAFGKAPATSARPSEDDDEIN